MASSSDDEIKLLASPLEAIRRRPGMYVGDTGVAGLHDLIWRLVERALDLHVARQVTDLQVEVSKDSWVTVRDDGPGIPVETDPRTRKTLLETVCTVLMSGGSAGLAFYYSSAYPVVNALSTRFEVETSRDGTCWALAYDQGEPTGGPRRMAGCSLAGTTVRFHPDRKHFGTIEFDQARIESRLQALAWLHPLLRVWFQGRRLECRGGLGGWAESVAASRGALAATYSTHQESHGVFVDLGLAWTVSADSAETDSRAFVNTREVGTGSHVDGFWQGMADFAAEVGASVQGRQAVRDALLPGLVCRLHVRLDDHRLNPRADHLNSPRVERALRQVLAYDLPDALWRDMRFREYLETRLGFAWTPRAPRRPG